MKVGILGSGDVGQALGRGFASKGYDVKIGSRDPSNPKLKDWLAKVGKKGSTGTFAETAAYGDIVVIATLGSAAEQAVDLAKPANLNGKLVIDVTNPLDFSKGMPPTNFTGLDDSLGERIQRKVPNGRVVKCWNTVPNSQMFNPTFKDAEMLIAGNDPAAKKDVGKILKEFGWKDSIDVGGIENSRWLEALVPLWVRAGMSLNTWNHIFQVRHD